jgi:hypothetical protein
MSGIQFALEAKGSQDAWMKQHPEAVDGKRLLLGKRNYQVGYQELQYDKTIDEKKNTITFRIQQNCDLINEVDLVVQFHDKPRSVQQILKTISVYYGSHRFDIFNAGDIETQIRTNCDIFNKKITFVNDRLIIPLVMAPFYKTNVVFPSTKYHELEVKVELKDTFTPKDLTLYGKTYFVEGREELFEESHEYITIQNQCPEEYRLKKGKNTLPLHFNHPVSLIYFWGFDKTKIKNVSLMLNDTPYYNGPIELLEHLKNQQGISADPSFIFFANDDPNSTVNFTRIDKSTLVIEAEEDMDDSPLYIVGLNLQPIRYANYMMGMMYTK